MVSFKLKLVAYFVLLTLVPIAATFWGFDSLARRSETRLADARLQAELRAAQNAFQDEAGSIARSATRLAADPAFQQALRARDRTALAGFVAANPNLRVRVDKKLDLGTKRTDAVVRTVDVLSRGTLLGRVSISLPLDRSLLDSIAKRSGLASGERLVVVHGGAVTVGPKPFVGDALPLRTGNPGIVSLGGTRYRALAAPARGGSAGASLAVLTPQHRIDAAVGRSRETMALVLAALLALGGVAAYLFGRSAVRPLRRLAQASQELARGRLAERVPVRGRDEFARLAQSFNEMAAQLEARMVELESERDRLARATGRIGEALAATHEPDQLLSVIVETAVEATGAYGGVVRDASGEERVRAGDPESGLQSLELPLQAGRRSFGSLVLAGPRFDAEERETAISLAGQAVIALENARLHRIVERQALVDPLTGLANRRSGEDVLRSELSRAERFGGELAVVIADLDGFKDVNDRYGHPFGDVVLCEFARRLRENVREIDVAARWGGEEFCLVLPGTDAAGGAHVAERTRIAFEDHPIVAPDGAPVRVTASFGVASFPGYAGPAAIVEAADAALYEAKRTGKNRVVTAAEAVGTVRDS